MMVEGIFLAIAVVVFVAVHVDLPSMGLNAAKQTSPLPKPISPQSKTRESAIN